MTCATATFPQFTPFDGRNFSLGDYRRAVFNGAAISLGTVAAAGVTASFVTTAAAWIVAAALAVNSHFHTRGPIGLETIAPATPYRIWVDTADHAGSLRVATKTAYALDAMPEDEPPGTVVPAVPTSAAPLRSDETPEVTNSVASPPPSLFDPSYGSKHELARFSTDHAAPQVAEAAPLLSTTTFQKPFTARQSHEITILPPDRDSRTAVYNIESHRVHLPNGQRLEAHSGLGKRLDDPRFVNHKNRGPTPPNVYDLVLRERPFHGVRAIRLNPVAGSTMFGRDGILAHTYMLGPSGQSFGCVSFKNYPAFLQAFLKGDVDRLVVVPRLGTTVSAAALARRNSSEQ